MRRASGDESDSAHTVITQPNSVSTNTAASRATRKEISSQALLLGVVLKSRK